MRKVIIGLWVVIIIFAVVGLGANLYELGEMQGIHMCTEALAH